MIILNFLLKDEFKKKIDFLYEKRIEKLPEDHKKLLKDSKEIEVIYLYTFIYWLVIMPPIHAL